MKYIIGKNRSQLEMFCLDEHIAKDNEVRMKQYKTDACKTCPVYDLCTRSKNKRGRVIERLAYAHLLDKKTT